MLFFLMGSRKVLQITQRNRLLNLVITLTVPVYAAFPLRSFGCVALLWKRSEVDGLALYVRQVIPVTHK